MSLGYKVKKFRELRGYSQDYMADQLGIVQTTYSNLESGKTEISKKRLIKITEILETTPEAIKTFDEKMVFNISHQKGDFAGHIIVNNSFSELSKLIETVTTPYKEEIARLQKENAELKKRLNEK